MARSKVFVGQLLWLRDKSLWHYSAMPGIESPAIMVFYTFTGSVVQLTISIKVKRFGATNDQRHIFAKPIAGNQFVEMSQGTRIIGHQIFIEKAATSQHGGDRIGPDAG